MLFRIVRGGGKGDGKIMLNGESTSKNFINLHFQLSPPHSLAILSLLHHQPTFYLTRFSSNLLLCRLSSLSDIK